MPFEPRIFNDPFEDPKQNDLRRFAEDHCEDHRGDNSVDNPAAEGSACEPSPVWDDAEMLGLPDDLAMLADQLRDDAEYLSQRHPATAAECAAVLGVSASENVHNKQPAFQPTIWNRPLARWSAVAAAVAAAAVLIAVGGLGVLQTSEPAIVQGGNTQQVPAERNASPRSPSSGTHILAVNTDNHGSDADFAQSQPNRLDDELFNRPLRVTPTAFLQDVSGPELDGMLDLLDTDGQGLSL